MTHSSTEPKISIIMPMYNAEKFLRQAICSVQEQTYKNWELIIVDDCSSDQSLDIAHLAADDDNRIRIIINRQRRGVAQSRNRGLDNIEGEFVAFLDSDDYWHHKKLRRQIDFMLATATPITFGTYSRVNEEGVVQGTVTPPDMVSYHSLLFTNVIGTLTAVYKTKMFSSLRFESIGNEDYLFWLTALDMIGKPIYATPSSNPLAYYRVRKGSLSANKARSAFWQWKIYRSHLGLSRLRSVYYLLHYAQKGVLKRLVL